MGEDSVETKRLENVVVKQCGRMGSNIEVRDGRTNKLLLQLRVPKKGSTWAIADCEASLDEETEIDKNHTFRSESETLSALNSSFGLGLGLGSA
mmetsp:Transcript_37127/g.90254  ORF Transcript_37127/g.90254 Transcript_37127/m.90254 type:complete len:94 (-) Transcript_37127:73-354(-)